VTVPEVWAAGFAAQPATAGKLDPPPDSGSVVVRPPLAVRLRPYAPLLVVIAVAAVFGALLGTPSDSPDPPPAASASPDAAAVARLDTTRVRLRDDLAIATEPAEQSAAAESLADAYERAAGRIASARVAAAARRAAAAYSALAVAARGESDADYAAAAGRVEVAEANLADALGSR
jgi:hypothetical protein